MDQENETVEQQPPASTKKEYIPMTFEQNQIQNSMKMSSLDNLLELEKQQNKSDHWNKLDKTRRIQLLHAFAETYCREKELAMRDMKTLVKTKDVIYNREKALLNLFLDFFSTRINGNS